MAKVRIGKWLVDEKELEQEFAEATKRGEEEMAREPQAKSAYYERASNRLVVELKNGATFIVPCELIQGLRGAEPDEIAEVELGPRGAALHWERLDVDFSVKGLMAGRFGNKAWMAELARRGERVISKRKPARGQTDGELSRRVRQERKIKVRRAS